MISTLLLFAALQAPDPVCFAKYAKNADTLAKVHLPSTTLTGYQKRARARLDSLLQLKCVTAPTPAPTPTPTPDPVPSGTAELPRVLLSFPYPTPTRSVTVPAGADLQAALNAAQRGDELILAAGATWTGNYSASSCGPGWITVRASGALPTGGRMRPSLAGGVAKLVTPNTDPALLATPASCRWRFVGFEAFAVSTTFEVYGIIRMEGTEIVLDRMYVHGTATAQIARCVTMNGSRQAVENSWLSDCHGDGFDAQAIHGGLGAGPFRIVNNYLEGSGENVMFGGQDPRVAGLVPSDIEIRGNHFRKPDAWHGTGWDIKNLLELKNAVRVLVEGNVLEGSWNANQTGWAVVMMSANQDGNCRWCRTTDVTIRKNLIRNVGAGINVSGGVNADTAPSRIVITENVVEPVNVGIYLGDARGFQTLAGSRDVTLERNVLGGNLGAALWNEGGGKCVYRGNQWVSGQYGVMASGAPGVPAALNYGCGVGNWIWEANVLAAGTTVTTAEATAIRSAVTTATAGVVVPP